VAYQKRVHADPGARLTAISPSLTDLSYSFLMV
jgi:hypothetical protein